MITILNSDLNNHFGFVGLILKQPLVLERMKPENIQLKQPLAYDHNPKLCYIKTNCRFPIIGSKWSNRWLMMWIDTEAIPPGPENIQLKQPLAYDHNPKLSFL